MLGRLRIEWLVFRSKLPERVWTAVAWRLPGSLAYWCAIRVATHTLGPGEHPDEHTVPQMLARWGCPHHLCGWCDRRHVGRCTAYREAVGDPLD